VKGRLRARNIRWGARRPWLVLAVTVVIVVGLAVAWQERLGPAAQARRTLLALGSPLEGFPASPVTTRSVDCEGGCVSASRTWNPGSSLTLASFSARVGAWTSSRALTGGADWTCGPQQGSFGADPPEGGCSLALTTSGTRGTPVFLWVVFRDQAALRAAYRESARTVPENQVADPLSRLGALALTEVGLQVVRQG